jgi:DNA-binding transcriptional LysR family regulator
MGVSNASVWSYDGLRMSLAQIRYFVAVADEGNVSRAARRLHVSQPPLSRQLKNLEDELGAQLFARTPRGVRLLPAGHVFLQHARVILREIQAAAMAVRRPVDGPNGAREQCALSTGFAR